jgi:branched-chain amino acid transport system substrate-binding protein
VGLIDDTNGQAPTTSIARVAAFQAVVNWANANGGVNGHPINLVTQLDSSTPTANLTAAQSLVQNKGATVIVEISNAMAGGASWLSSNGTPVIAAPSLSPVVSQYRTFFTPNGGYNTNPTLWNTDVATFFKKIGVKKIGSLSSNSTASAQIASDVVNSAPLVGLKKGYIDTNVPQGNTNWTPYVLGFQNTNTDSIETHLSDSTGTLLFLAAAAQQGLKLKVLSPVLYNTATLNNPASNGLMQGIYTYTQYDPSTSKAPIKKMQGILSQYGDAANSTFPGSNEVSGYGVGLLLLEALRVGGVNPTSASVLKNLSHVRNWPSGGIYGRPINFTLEHTNKAPTLLGSCLWFLQAKGNVFVQVLKGKPICTPTVQIHF